MSALSLLKHRIGSGIGNRRRKGIETPRRIGQLWVNYRDNNLTSQIQIQIPKFHVGNHLTRLFHILLWTNLRTQLLPVPPRPLLVTILDSPRTLSVRGKPEVLARIRSRNGARSP